jgi:hypothetical protein
VPPRLAPEAALPVLSCATRRRRSASLSSSALEDSMGFTLCFFGGRTGDASESEDTEVAGGLGLPEVPGIGETLDGPVADQLILSGAAPSSSSDSVAESPSDCALDGPVYSTDVARIDSF